MCATDPSDYDSSVLAFLRTGEPSPSLLSAAASCAFSLFAFAANSLRFVSIFALSRTFIVSNSLLRCAFNSGMFLNSSLHRKH